MFPIFIPIHSTPARCPHCRHPENVKRVCGHCNYAYADESGGFSVVATFGAALIFLWLIFTILSWVMPFSGQPTLVEVIISEAVFVRDLLHRIW